MSRQPTPDIMAAVLNPAESFTTLPADKIRTDGGTQMRAQLDEETISEYLEAMRSNGSWAPFPPAVVFYDGETHWLGDGFHRLEAFRSMRFAGARPPEVLVDIRSGTRQDAILHAAGANADHGLRRTDADKRRAVRTILTGSEWSDWSDRQIAQICNVSPTFVGKIRKSLVESDTVHVDSMNTERTFVHPKTGKPTTMKTGKIGTTKQEPAPLHTLDIGSIIVRAIERSNTGDDPQRQLDFLDRATMSDFMAARDAAWKETETDPGWMGRMIRPDRLNDALERIKQNLTNAVERERKQTQPPTPVDPDILPQWAQEEPEPSTAAPAATEPTTVTVTLDYDTAAAIIRLGDKGKLPKIIPGLQKFTDDLVLACNAAVELAAQNAPQPSEEQLPEWRLYWQTEDEDEYQTLDTEWNVEDITRTLVAVRLIEEEDDLDLCKPLRKRYHQLSGG